MYNQISLPTKARATNLLNEIIAFRLRHDYLESDLSDFIMLKNRHEKTTGMPLDNDLLITLIMQKTTGLLQQHLRLNVRKISTFTEALEIVNSYVESRHLVVPSRNDGPGYWSTERNCRHCHCPAGSECAEIIQGRKTKEGYKWDMWEMNFLALVTGRDSLVKE
ncbi:hypothetical protein AK812_SmicGene38411 [Symbiodinium microadriaticum]|uniref:Uncharacterized protein n=1 Tax=Symbiodinium microadriaticum TaxID=2951 RepID=A0A1Q9CDS3_SYMMI|nr:hypothetical protein AK812_SmicGene38411 [Symbiodinium microadriaticum]